MPEVFNRLIPASSLKEHYCVKGHFYKLDVGNGNKIPCRSIAEIEVNEGSARELDFVIIMMNPGACRPMTEKFDYEPESVAPTEIIQGKWKRELVPVVPDPTLYQIMRLMKKVGAGRVQVLNLCDLMESDSRQLEDFYLETVRSDPSGSFSITTPSRMSELKETIQSSRLAMPIFAWSQRPLLKNYATEVLKEFPSHIGIPMQSPWFRHPKPLKEKEKQIWLAVICKQIQGKKVSSPSISVSVSGQLVQDSMKNTFYNEFDLERFPDSPVSEPDYRNAFQIERDRIIFSYPFRRLQSKTQVFQSGEYDFYRTRLTHSIEVAKICRSICEYLRGSSNFLSNTFYIDSDLTEAIGLAHDLGHPPFGHMGERKLNELMKPHGGFEGNAQTLRIITELIYERPGATKGISPTRAFLDGIMKYKALFSECTQKAADGSRQYPENHFIYNEQILWRNRLFGDNAPAKLLKTNEAMNSFKSIECQIMDWADDAAYSINDVVDGIHARYINIGRLTEWAATQELNSTESELLDKLCQVISENRYEAYFGSRIGLFVHGCKLLKREGFLSKTTNRHAFTLKVDDDIETESGLYKRIALDLIFCSPQLQQVEFKRGYILQKLFDALCEHGIEKREKRLRILPTQEFELIEQESSDGGRFRRLCDFISGLTDSLAVRTYKRLYDPDLSLITELL